MKVLHFVHNYYGFSGASRQAKNLVESLNQLDSSIDNRFLTLNNKDCYSSDDSFVFKCSGGSFFLRLINYFKVLLKFQPAIVHFHGGDFLLLVLCKLFNVKVFWKTTLYKGDDFHILSTKGKLSFIKRKLINLIDLNNTLTRQIYNINKKYLDESKLTIISNGVFISEFSVKSKENVAVIISAIIPRKCVIEAIEFFNENLRSKGFILLVIGPIYPELDGFSEDYLLEFNKLLDNKVQYIGEIDFSEVNIYLRRAKYLLHFSDAEGLPNVVLESLSCSCFPITKSMDGLYSELYTDGITGFNIENNSFFEDENFESVNNKGRDYAIENFAFEKIESKTMIAYKEINKIFHGL